MRYLLVFSMLISFSLINSCKKEEETNNWTLQISKVKHSYIATQRAILDKCKLSYKEFYLDMNFFHSVPAEYALNYCKDTWKLSYNDFILLGPYRNGFPLLDIGFEEDKMEFDVSSINYSYIDYTTSSPFSGIINDTVNYPSIYVSLIPSLNTIGGSKNITCGFHAIEFLLWGEDNSLSTTGTRQNLEYLNTGTINLRRMQFLFYSVKNLNTLISNLNYDEEYADNLYKNDSKEFLNVIISSINTFISEDFIKEAIETPLNSSNSKFELSDFSDNTVDNIKSKLKALKYVLDGRDLFKNIDQNSYFLGDFIKEVDKEKYDNINSSLEAIESKLNSISLTFENAILDNNSRSKLFSVIEELKSIKNNLIAFESLVNSTN